MPASQISRICWTFTNLLKCKSVAISTCYWLFRPTRSQIPFKIDFEIARTYFDRLPFAIVGLFCKMSCTKVASRNCCTVLCCLGWWQLGRLIAILNTFTTGDDWHVALIIITNSHSRVYGISLLLDALCRPSHNTVQKRVLFYILLIVTNSIRLQIINVRSLLL